MDLNTDFVQNMDKNGRSFEKYGQKRIISLKRTKTDQNIAGFLRNGGTLVTGSPAQAPFRKKWVRVGRGQIAHTILTPPGWTVLL